MTETELAAIEALEHIEPKVPIEAGRFVARMEIARMQAKLLQKAARQAEAALWAIDDTEVAALLTGTPDQRRRGRALSRALSQIRAAVAGVEVMVSAALEGIELRPEEEPQP